MHLALIGFRCSGKTTVGGILARTLGLELTDTDRLVEEMSGLSVARLVADRGWDEFRRLETMALEKALGADPGVIATGGGIVLSVYNVSMMRKKSEVFWLNAPAEVIRVRMAANGEALSRPGLTGCDAIEEVPALLEAREDFYRKAADHVVDAGFSGPEPVAGRILKLVKARTGRKGVV